MSPLRAWAPRNQRAYDTKPSACGTNISMVGAMKESGMQTVYPYDGAVDSEKFLHFLEAKLLPKMTKDDVIIMDNSSIHHSKVVKARLQELSVEVLYMPPYSPELNPIEEAWSAIKGRLRRRKARTIPEYVDGLVEACNAIDSNKCKGFFRHAAQFGSLC